MVVGGVWLLGGVPGVAVIGLTTRRYLELRLDQVSHRPAAPLLSSPLQPISRGLCRTPSPLL